MESTKTLIPKHEQGETALMYALRLKKTGFIPAEVMDPSFYEIAQHQQHEKKKEIEENLKKDHKCINCLGSGVVEGKDPLKKDYISIFAGQEVVTCHVCFGSGDETAQVDDLSPQEIELTGHLKEKNVNEKKLRPDFIHRIFWYCQYKGISDKFEIIFLSRVRMIIKDGYEYVSCDARPSWKYKELIENKKQGKVENEEVPF